MNFADRALIALSGGASRSAVFNDTALRNILKAGYGLEEAAAQGAAQPDFSVFNLGGFDPEPAKSIGERPVAERRIDALWRGAIRISARFPKARVEAVAAASLSLAGLDAEVAAANGGVLPGGDALEAARRARLQRRIEETAAHPDAAPSAIIDAWLSSADAATVGELILAGGTSAATHLQLTFSEPIGGDAFTEMDLPVAVAVMIRDPAEPGTSLADIVAGARWVQAAMRRAGFEPKPPSEGAALGRPVTALVVPDNWFDDDDWPGADKDGRIASAGTWMAREAVALVPVGL